MAENFDWSTLISDPSKIVPSVNPDGSPNFGAFQLNLAQAMAEQAQRNPGPIPAPSPPQSLDMSAIGNQFVVGAPAVPDVAPPPVSAPVLETPSVPAAQPADKPAMLTIALYKGPPSNRWRLLAHKIICWVTGEPWSHAELVVPGGSWGASYIDGGVRFKERISFDDGKWELFTIEGDEASAVQWFKDHEGQGFDMFGLLGFILPWRVSDRTRWFCFEAIAAALGLPNSHRAKASDLIKVIR